jgi:hypothetical protein
MKKTVSANVQTEIVKTITRPGYLVEIAFSTPFRISTRGDVNWNGGVFITWGAQVDMEFDASRSAVGGTLTLQNTENALGTLVLLEGVADRPIRIWSFYGETPGLHDVVPQLFGVGDSASINPSKGTVTISVMQSGGSTLFAPRAYITREAGYNFLPAAGTLINWGGEQFRLERED